MIVVIGYDNREKPKHNPIASIANSDEQLGLL